MAHNSSGMKEKQGHRSISANGIETDDMVMEFAFIPISPNTLEITNKMLEKARGKCSGHRETYIMGTGEEEEWME